MNFTLAFHYLNISASLGFPDAQRELGFLYDTGKGTPINKPMVKFSFFFLIEKFLKCF